MRAQAHEDVWIRSDDGLRLQATYFPGIDGGNPDKAVICFHGYTSEAMSDYSLSLIHIYNLIILFLRWEAVCIKQTVSLNFVY